jgi:hypothetical protein
MMRASAVADQTRSTWGGGVPGAALPFLRGLARSLCPTATLTPALQLQHTLLACSLMQAPDSSWVGRCGPRAFLQLTHDSLQLVTPLRGRFVPSRGPLNSG